MKNSLKTSAFGLFVLLSTSLSSQSDSLGMAGDNLDLNAVLSIFKQSSSVEDFEKRLNSADTKVNNLDLNGDGQVDYLRVVDYGKDDFHSIVIQSPVSKSESQDVAVIEILKKGDNTAHVQIVGDETLYGKDYIIEPKDQAPLATTGSKKNNSNDDDVYADPNSSSPNTQVMINVWAWPSVNYLYSPGYSYYASPWYYGYYPGWYSPWRPYGWNAYHRGFIGYNYGFYGYRRYHHAFPHVHTYYYGKRVSSGYVQKTAPHYNSHRDGRQNTGPRNTSGTKRNTNSGNRNTGQNNRVEDNRQRQNNSGGTQRTNQQKQSQNRGSQKVNSTPRSTNSGGGSRNTGGGGHSGGGGRSGGGGARSGGGGHR